MEEHRKHAPWARTSLVLILSSPERRYPSCRPPLLIVLLVLAVEVAGLTAECLAALKKFRCTSGLFLESLRPFFRQLRLWVLRRE
jgi:hypothetical protein